MNKGTHTTSFPNILSLLSFILILACQTGCTYHPMTPRGMSDIGEILPFGSQSTDALVGVMPDTYGDLAGAPLHTPLSPGDVLKLHIFDDDVFSGHYVINQDGSIRIPFLGTVKTVGKPAHQVEAELVTLFLDAQIFKSTLLRLSLEVVEWAPALVSVSGAVIEPGQVTINEPRLSSEDTRPELRSGAYTAKRFIQHAIQAAGGLRADANLQDVLIERNGIRYKLSLKDLFLGTKVANIGLISGDHVSIGSVGVFQAPLARPSAFTAPGFRVYLSNLTTPALNNASSSIGRDSTRLPNGSRLSHAITSANCFGGTPIFNAPRRIKYVTKNPLTRTLTTHVYSVEEVMLKANDPIHNPYLMPEDQLGCYEGPVAIIREAARFAYDVVSPIKAADYLRGRRHD